METIPHTRTRTKSDESTTAMTVHHESGSGTTSAELTRTCERLSDRSIKVNLDKLSSRYLPQVAVNFPIENNTET